MDSFIDFGYCSNLKEPSSSHQERSLFILGRSLIKLKLPKAFVNHFRILKFCSPTHSHCCLVLAERCRPLFYQCNEIFNPCADLLHPCKRLLKPPCTLRNIPGGRLQCSPVLAEHSASLAHGTQAMRNSSQACRNAP